MPIDLPPDCRLLIEHTRQWPDYQSPAFKPFLKKLHERMDCERLNQAGWSPIATVAKSRRQVRRVSFEEGRLAFRVPAIAVEKHRDGGVTLTLTIDGPQRRFAAELPPTAWNELRAQDAATHPPPPPIERPGQLRELPPMGCHGWFVTLEAADQRKAWRRDAHECQGERDADALTYGYRLANLALNTIPECAEARAAGTTDTAPEAPVRGLIRCAGRFSPKGLDPNGGSDPASSRGWIDDRLERPPATASTPPR